MKDKNIFLVRTTIFCMVLLCLICTASAYTTPYYWNTHSVGYTIDSSIPSAYASSANSAANSWTNSGADFSYYNSVNSNNKVQYSSLGSNVLGTCTCTYYTGTTRLSKIIIKLNSYYSTSWSTSSTCPSGKYDVQSVFAHEFGHGVGLGHSSTNSATMWATTSSGSTAKRSLELDDKNGIKAIYGT